MKQVTLVGPWDFEVARPNGTGQAKETEFASEPQQQQNKKINPRAERAGRAAAAKNPEMASAQIRIKS